MDLVSGGTSARAAALHLDVSVSAAIKLMQRVRYGFDGGGVDLPPSPAFRGGGHADYLRKLTEMHKGITWVKIEAKLAEGGVTVSASAIWRMLCRLGLTQ